MTRRGREKDSISLTWGLHGVIFSGYPVRKNDPMQAQVVGPQVVGFLSIIREEPTRYPVSKFRFR